MPILGIDFGKKKIGLALAEGFLATPYCVFKPLSEDKVISDIVTVINNELVELVVVGVSEGNMAKETVKFVEKLHNKTPCRIILQDETLSTHEAQQLAIAAGIKRSKRRSMEDAYAAAVMLQSYLDANIKKP